MKVGRFKRFCHIPCFQKLPPSRAPQARGEACVTVLERRSHLGLPAEGRPWPSDDDDGGDGDDDDAPEEDCIGRNWRQRSLLPIDRVDNPAYSAPSDQSS